MSLHGTSLRENVVPEKPRRRSAFCVSFFVSLPAHAMWFVIGGVLFCFQVGRFVVDVLYQFSEHLEQ